MMTRQEAERSCKLLILMALLVTVGCAGGLKQLRPYAEIPHLARLAEAKEATPARTVMVTVGEAGGKPVRLAMERVGGGDDGPLVVMLHGLLSNRTVWRYVAGGLGRDHRLLLVDMVGCGESDAPRPSDLGDGGYSPDAQARRVLRGLRNYMLRHETPSSLVLVGHSLGGGVILRMLGNEDLRRQYADVVGLVERAVLLAPLDFAVEKEYPQFGAIQRLGQPKAAIASMLGLLKAKIAEASLAGYHDPASAPREGARRQVDILRKRRTRNAARAMIAQAVPFDLESRRPRWDRIEELVDDYGNVEEPVLMLWGARDETLPHSMGYKLQSQLPDARLRVVERSKHSLLTERPRLVSAQIRRFVAGREDTGGPIARMDPDISSGVSDAATWFLASLTW